MDVIEMAGLTSLPCSRNHVLTPAARTLEVYGVRKQHRLTTDLVSWKGYGPEHNTWEPEANLYVCLVRTVNRALTQRSLIVDCLPQLSPDSASLPSPIGLLDETKLSPGRHGAVDMFPIDCTRSACSEHARDMIDAYLANLPKHSAKRGRQSMGTPSKPPAKRGRPSKASLAAKAIEDEEITFPDTHTDSADKFMDVADWEPIVKQVDSIERGSNNDLAVYLTM